MICYSELVVGGGMSAPPKTISNAIANPKNIPAIANAIHMRGRLVRGDSMAPNFQIDMTPVV